MNIDEIRAYCLSKPGAFEDFPFGDEVLVLKVADKMFALLSEYEGLSVSLKCDPMFAEALRQKYSFVTPGYHFNKRHWNSVSVCPELSLTQLHEWIDHSYELVVSKLTCKKRELLK